MLRVDIRDCQWAFVNTAINSVVNVVKQNPKQKEFSVENVAEIEIVELDEGQARYSVATDW